MKRTVPLLITATVGFVLIISRFIPATVGWGEVASVWFDILAAIAFILGGSNLLKLQLKKISDRTAGWGYAVVTLAAFLVTLTVGLLKIGSPPAPDQEFFGETFAHLELADFPETQVASVDGTIPEKADGAELPLSVRRQIREQNGRVLFRGWMLRSQMRDLLDFEDTLRWQCTVERLFEQAQPPEELAPNVSYYADHDALGYKGFMSDEDRDRLLELGRENAAWQHAVDEIYETSRRTTRMPVEQLPANFQIAASLEPVLEYDAEHKELVLRGPMSVAQRNDLARQFPAAKPIGGEDRAAFLRELESLGEPLNEEQRAAFDRAIESVWTPEQLVLALNGAGAAKEEDKTACEMLEEMQAGVRNIDPQKTVGEDVQLNPRQEELVEQFARDAEFTPDELIEQMREAGTFNDAQAAELRRFLNQGSTVGEQNRTLDRELLKHGPLTPAQRDFLLQDIRSQLAWRATVAELFFAAHLVKYKWSGEYRAEGSPFWWMYEYLFKPLTATMFALLAFYVASAAFRAFRAKNVEAILLLGTAFIILLGRTFAGVWLTAWIPDELAGLRIENLTTYIMQIFTTAGNRAIMIGIALGIASTSLKVLLGVDRSYLGSREG
ncbi:MAG TPA: hypothetical protein VML55_21415 [Planctomycetaceae bacterium]|nr:hypothetical protein [Planctomycetaceae bacterium]